MMSEGAKDSKQQTNLTNFHLTINRVGWDPASSPVKNPGYTHQFVEVYRLLTVIVVFSADTRLCMSLAL